MYHKKLQAAVSICNNQEMFPTNLKEILLEYYILENDAEDEYPGYIGKLFGVEIVKKEFQKDDTIVIENKLINDVCCNQKGIEELVNKLICHTVTPIALNNILEDILGII